MRSKHWTARAALILGTTAALLAGVGAGPSEGANVGFVSAQGGQFVLNGSPFRFVGTNAYFMLDAATYGSTAHTDGMLALANSLGFTVLRTWGFLDGISRGLQPSAGVYNESAFQAMDYVLYKADLAGVRLLVTLVNYWSDYGGMPQYVKWCAPGQAVDAFYTNATCKQMYKNYLSHFLNRVNTYNGRVYMNDPTVFGWELANEPRSGDATGTIVNQWAAETAAYVKSIDGNHVVGTGEEGFDTTSSGYSPVSAYNNNTWMFDGTGAGVSFTRNSALSQIDFASIHLYPGYWNLPASAGSTWISDHVQIARNLGKPLVLGEFGYSGSPWSVFQPWMQTFETEQAGGALIWELICSSVCGNYGGGFATIYPPSSTVSTGMAQAAATANADPSPPSPPPSPSFTIRTTTVTPATPSVGQGATIATSVTASAAASGIVVTLGVLDSTGVTVSQSVYSAQSFSAGTTLSYTWNWPGASLAGSYSVKVVVSSADGSTQYAAANPAAIFSVQAAPAAGFTVASTTASPSTVSRNRTLKVTASVTATTAASGILVDLEIYDAAGTRVGQHVCTKSFSAGQTQTCAWSFKVKLAPGAYTVKVGVFSANWTTLYTWVNQAATFVVQ
jgi:Cellulase (glycosyl hydrolase family 5)/Wzt C-terminal domain